VQVAGIRFYRDYRFAQTQRVATIVANIGADIHQYINIREQFTHNHGFFRLKGAGCHGIVTRESKAPWGCPGWMALIQQIAGVTVEKRHGGKALNNRFDQFFHYGISG